MADQNQNIHNSEPLRISDRPVPIGEVTTTTVNEFNQNAPTVSNYTLSYHQSNSSSGAESRQSNTHTSHNTGQNSAVGLPNTRQSSAC